MTHLRATHNRMFKTRVSFDCFDTSKFTQQDSKKRGRQNVHVWQTWQSYYLRVCRVSNLQLNHWSSRFLICACCLNCRRVVSLRTSSPFWLAGKLRRTRKRQRAAKLFWCAARAWLLTISLKRRNCSQVIALSLLNLPYNAWRYWKNVLTTELLKPRIRTTHTLLGTYWRKKVLVFLFVFGHVKQRRQI